MLNNPEVLRQVAALPSYHTTCHHNLMSPCTTPTTLPLDDGDREEPLPATGDDEEHGPPDVQPRVHAGGAGGAGATITITTTSLSTTTTPCLTTTPSPQAILQRMYRDVQEPVLNAMGGPNPFQDLRGQAAAPAPTPSTETTAPAPNPWAPPAGATPATTGAPPAPGLGAALGQGGGVFTSPGMQSLMGQMRDNPTLMSQVT